MSSIRYACAVGAVVALAAGCSSGGDASTDAAATTTDSAATTTGETTTGQGTSTESSGATTSAEEGRTSVTVEAGECVTLTGGETTADAVPADCGSAEANYRVSSKVRENGQCPSDTDQVYFETVNGVEQGALCLDIDWVVDQCMSMPIGEPARRVDCADPEASFVSKATRIIEGTDSVDQCPTGGFAYSERRFVVCVTEPSAPVPAATSTSPAAGP